MNLIPHYPVPPQQSVETVTGYPIMQQYSGDPNAGGIGVFQAVPSFNPLPLQAVPPPPPLHYQASYDDGFEIPPGFFPAFGSTPGNESSGYGGEFYSSGEQTDCSGTTNGVHRNRKAADRSPTEQAGYRQMHVGGHSTQMQQLQSSPKAIPLATFEGRRTAPPQCGPPAVSTAPAPTPLFPKPVPYFPVISVPCFDNGLASFVNYNATVSQDPHGNDMPFNGSFVCSRRFVKMNN